MSVSVLSKWGNSFALRMPKDVMSNYKEGDHFEVMDDFDGLHFKKARNIKKYDIKDVLEILSSDKNGEIDWGKPSGKEIW